MIETRIVDVPAQDEFGNYARVLSNGTMYLVPGFPAIRQQAGRKAELTGDWDFDGFGTVNPMSWRDVGAADVKPLQVMVSAITGEVIIDDPRLSSEVLRFGGTTPAEPPEQGKYVRKTTTEAKSMAIPGSGYSYVPGGNPFANQTALQQSFAQQQQFAQQQSNTGAAIAGVVNAADPCKYLPAAAQAACRAALAIGTAAVSGSSSSSSSSSSLASGKCPPGFAWVSVGGTGSCVAVQNALPGGQPLTLGGTSVATSGSLGLSALTPTQVGTITRSDGSTGPILRCPRRYVLGQDYLCYPKSMIPNQLRAHPRGTRPLLTGGEVKILRRAKTLEKKVSKLGSKFGKKTCHCSSTKRRKK